MHIMKHILFLLLVCSSALVFSVEPVDINTASKEVLMEIKGVGEKRADAIIEYRETHGNFHSLEELLEVRGIGTAVVEDNRDRLRVGKSR